MMHFGCHSLTYKRLIEGDYMARGKQRIVDLYRNDVRWKYFSFYCIRVSTFLLVPLKISDKGPKRLSVMIPR